VLELYSFSFKYLSNLLQLVLSYGQEIIQASLLTFQRGKLIFKLLLQTRYIRIMLLLLTGQILDVNAKLIFKGDVLSDVFLKLLNYLLIL